MIPARALTAFQRFRTEGGEVRLAAAYRPASFEGGAWISLLGVLGLAGWGFRRVKTASF